MNPNPSPNSFQRFMHRIAMLKPVSLALARVLHRADRIVLKLTDGKHTVAELFLPMIELTSIGAKTGQPRIMPLAAVRDGDKFALIGSNFGQKNNPGWYYNLKANPNCTVRVDGKSSEYIAREAQDEERERYWRMAVGFYAGYELYEKRAAHRKIPVVILEPAK